MLKRDKRSNISKVLHTIWVHDGISRVDIARLNDLDKSTVTKIVNELIEEQLITVVAEGEAGPQGGRKPVILKINGKYGAVIGVEVQPHFVRLCAIDLYGEVIEIDIKIISPLPIDNKLFKKHIIPFAENIEKKGYTVLGLGIGLPGVINPFSNIISKSIPLSIEDEFDFNKVSIEWNYGPIIIENDANCCAWGELASRRQEKIRDFLTVLIEHSDALSKKVPVSPLAVGFGLVLNGLVHHGKDFSSGEFRSINWREKSPSQFSLSDNEIDELKQNDEYRKRFLKELSQHIAFLVNMFNMSSVLIGGDFSLFEEELPDIFQTELKKNWAYTSVVDCSLGFLTYGTDAVAYGAAGMILNNLFSEVPIRSQEGIILPNSIDFLYKYGV